MLKIALKQLNSTYTLTFCKGEVRLFKFLFGMVTKL